MFARCFCLVLVGAFLFPSTATAQSPDSASARTGPRQKVQRDPWHYRLAMGTLTSTTVVAQIYDADSTYKSLRRGGVELNPVLSWASHNPWTYLAIKSGGLAGTLWTVHRMGKRHKVAAVLTLVALNGVYYKIIKENYAIARRPMME
jgi:hypothetical protein